MRAGDSFVYLEIAETLRRRVAAGEIKAGDRLPSMRAMAEQWGCSPNTVARAYAQLSQEGLVSAHRGGGTRVTPGLHAQGVSPPTEWQWADLVNRAEQYLLKALGQGHSAAHAEAALATAISRWGDLQRRRTAAGGGDSPAGAGRSADSAGRLRFAGSHDLSVEALVRALSERPVPVTMTTEYVGSLGGLIAMARGEADLAGSHLWDESTGTFNTAFIQRVLPGREIVLINLVQRVQGLIVPAGNPQGLRGVGDLGDEGVIFVNRQAGSGTRVWLDAWLRRAGVPAKTVSGYEREETTHVAVARAVAEGEATVGLGIGPAAAAYGLDFVPLFKERYDLVLPAENASLPGVEAVRAVLVSEDFRGVVSALGGYDLSLTGQEMTIG